MWSPGSPGLFHIQIPNRDISVCHYVHYEYFGHVPPFNQLCKLRYYFYIWLFLSGAKSFAQDPSLYFNKLTTVNGLSHNKVNCISEDKRGFIWIGTDDGLNRYDGNNIVIFRSQPGDTASLSGNIITSIFQDENEVFWITTSDGGLTRYDYRLPPKNQFRQYKHLPGDSNSIPGNSINAQIQDPYGYLWLATNGNGLLRFNKNTGKFDEIIQGNHSTILSLCIDRSGMIWAGRTGGSILKINPRNLSYTYDPKYENLYAKLPHATVSSLFMDRQQNVWYGSWDKVLYRLNANTGQEEIFRNQPKPFSLVNDDILCMKQDKAGWIWMGGRYNGLHIFDPDRNKFYNYENDISKEGTVADNCINTIFIDHAGTIWLGTNKGVSVNDPRQQQFNQIFLPHSNKDITIYDFYKTDGELWLATSDGIFIKRNGNDKFIHMPLLYKGNKLAVTKFFEDRDNRFYIGTDYSLFLYNRADDSFSLLPNTEKDSVMSKIIESRIVSVLRDTIEGHPVLLTSPYGHYLTYYDLESRNWVSRLDTAKKIIRRFSLKDNLIRKFYRTPGGTIWMANAKMGLGEWSGGALPTVRYYSNNPQNAQAISNDNVYDILSDSLGNLWISTYGGGLNYLNTVSKKFTHHSLSNNLLEGIQTDNHGNVWMISNGNLHKYDPRMNTYSSYSLPDIEKSGGVRGYIFKDNEGKFYLAGTNYMIVFNPEDIHESYRQPNIYFTDFKIFNNSWSHLLFEKEIQLEHDQNYLNIDFSAPDFSSGKIRYSYKMEGWDKDWIDAEGRNYAQYSNLNGGLYTFLVKATQNIAGGNENIARLSIRIIPPVWKRWWFLALVIILIDLLIYLIYRYRINQLVKLQNMRNKIAQDLHDSVGSTLSSISVYSQVAKLQHERGNFNELKDIINKVGITSSDMISEMNDIVWTINPRNDGMEKIFQRMESFARPLLLTKNIRFEFNYENHIEHLNLSMEKRKNLYLIFKEIVNNTLKYSSADLLQIEITLSNHHLLFSARDNGIGFYPVQMEEHAAKSLSGNGLNNMKRRAAEMNGAFEIHSQPGAGTAIYLKFPIP